jgi:ubiquitin carboxyl-terminal hydrolase 25/28
LHAICVHEGNGEGGHYFNFIKDHMFNRWRKFNDSRVSDVTEDEVFQSANGGFAARTAFWVVYINSAQRQKAIQYSIYDCNNMHFSYERLIPPKIK